MQSVVHLLLLAVRVEVPPDARGLENQTRNVA